MNKNLLQSRFKRLLMYKNKSITNTLFQKHNERITNTIKILNERAEKLNVPCSVIINTYLDYYVNVLHKCNPNSLFIKLTEFFDKYEHSFLKTNITDDDVELAYIIEDVWNTMNNNSLISMPFRMRGVLLGCGIKLNFNTFFKHNHNFLNFCIIAHFLNTQGTEFSMLSGLSEFFLHLPIIKKTPKEYIISEYISCKNSLEIYHNSFYGSSAKTHLLKSNWYYNA